MSNPELLDAVEHLFAIKHALKRLEEEAARYQAVINEYADAGEAIPAITHDGVQYRAKVVASERMTVDEDVFKAVLPELFDQHAEKTISRASVMRLIDNGDISPDQAAKFVRLKKTRPYTRFEAVTEGGSTNE